MGVSHTALDRWVRQLSQEHNGETLEKGQAITETQREIQDLKARIRRLEREKAILKKATALLMSEMTNVLLDNDIEGCKTTESLIDETQDIPVYDKSGLYGGV